MLRTKLGRIFLIIFLAITGIMILLSYNEYQNTVKLKYLEQEKQLLEIDTQLNDRITSYDKILVEKGAKNLDDDKKTQVLNEYFQPVVLEIASKYPRTALGLYSKDLDRNVAIGPQFDNSYLRKVSFPNGFIIYQTGVYRALKVEKSIAWDGKPVFAVHLPLVREGKIIGHAFANTPIEFLNEAIYIETFQRVKFVFIIWLLVVLLIWYDFFNLRKARAELIESITNDLDTSLLKGYPEYLPIIQAFNKLQQENLKQKEEIETILNSISDFFFTLDKNYVFTYCNKVAIEKFYGFNPIGNHIWTEFPQTEPRIAEIYEEVIHKNQPAYYEVQSRVNGKWMGVNVYPSKDGGVSVFFRDITERRELLYTIHEQKEKLETILNNVSDMITVLDKDLTHIYCNPGAIEFFGKDYTGYSYLGPVFSGATVFIAKIRETIAEQKPRCFETQSIVNGRWVEVTLYPSYDGGVIIFSKDINEKKEVEKHLQKMDQLACMSQMAASISHEVRNPLTTVRGYLQLLSTKDDVAHYSSKYELMISELDRATGIIEEFLSAARITLNKKQNTNLNTIITQLQPLLEADALKNAQEIEFILNDIPDLLLSDKEIKQIINNLTRNAIEAMDNHGKVIIRTEYREKEVVLTISDTGKGIPQNVLDRIGTPFLTTKDNGNGIGLAVCYGIAENHDAKIDVKSSPKGTAFCIRFPVVIE